MSAFVDELGEPRRRDDFGPVLGEEEISGEHGAPEERKDHSRHRAEPGHRVFKDNVLEEERQKKPEFENV